MSLYPRVKNREWIQQAFMLPSDSISDADMQRRLFTYAAWKYTDTTVGGNFTINNPPQYTRNADIKMGGRGSSIHSPGNAGAMEGQYLTQGSSNQYGMSMSKGMGRFYSEQMDDNAVAVNIRFGVPEFNSLTQFFGAFYDPEASVFARTGKGTGLCYSAGKALTAIATLPLLPAVWGGALYRYFSGKPASKFYYLKPTMALYWQACNTIANGIAVNMGLIPRWLHENEDQMIRGQNGQKKSDYLTYMRDVFGGQQGNFLDPDQPGMGIADAKQDILDGVRRQNTDLVNSSGGFDIRAVALRAQRLANAAHKETTAALSSRPARENYQQALDDHRQAARQAQLKTVQSPAPFMNASQYIESYLKVSKNQLPSGDISLDGVTEEAENLQQYDADGAGVQAQGVAAYYSKNKNSTASILGIPKSAAPPPPPAEGEEAAAPSSQKGVVENLKTTAGEFFEHLKSSMNEASEFVTFRVDNPGSSSESFSNSTKEAGIASKINSTSSGNRDQRFNFANGNVGDNVLTNLVESAAKGVASLLEGAADYVGLSGIAALGGSAFVDIPKHWDSSTAQLPRADFTIELRSPYGNPISRMQNLYIPLSMLLAGALPISTGPHSFTSPFICEVYSKGRNVIRLGMIDSMSISRGQGNVGWTQEGAPLGIDVSFSVVDLSSILHMPITANMGTWQRFFMGAADLIGGDALVEGAALLAPSTYDEHSTYTDYLAVLGGLGLQDLTLSTLSNLTLRLANKRVQFQSWRSPANLAIWTSEVMPGRIYRNLIGYTARGD